MRFFIEQEAWRQLEARVPTLKSVKLLESVDSKLVLIAQTEKKVAFVTIDPAALKAEHYTRDFISKGIVEPAVAQIVQELEKL